MKTIAAIPDPESELLVEIQSRERLHQGFIALDRYKLRHQRFAGGWTDPMIREVVVRRPAVAVLPYDPVADRLLLIEQFRLPARVAGLPGWQIEVIAGLQDGDETPEDNARREAKEEAGCELTALIPMCRFLTSPGLTTELTFLFLGKFDSNAVGRFGGRPDEHEDIRITLIPGTEAASLLNNPRAENANVVAALLWFMLNRERARQEWGAD